MLTIQIINIFIDFVPESFVFISMTHTTEVIRIVYNVYSLTILSWFLMDVEQFGYQTVILLVILIFYQIANLLSKLERRLVFICFNIQIFHFFFLLWFSFNFWEFQSVYFIFHSLFLHVNCQTGFFPSRSIRSLNGTLSIRANASAVILSFLSSPRIRSSRYSLFPVSLFVNRVFLNVTPQAM